MPFTDSSGVRIHYELRGTSTGAPLVLVHGYTASGRTQWELTGVTKDLAARHRMLLVDVRGHGESEKPHDAARYSLALLASDVLAAMDDSGFERADLGGYSMGAMIAMELLLEHGGRFDRAILGGMGAVFPRSRKENCRDEEDGDARRYWPGPVETLKSWAYFARHYDYRAMRALAGRTFSNGPVDVARLHEITHPVLAVCGTRDRFCPGTRILAERIPDCRRVLVPGVGHIATARDPRYRAAIAEFLTTTPRRI
jgi:pimeloyl-ACP methyl ester carboxylesterase